MIMDEARQRKYSKLYATVNRFLEEYQGGQIFFTQLDNAVKFDPEILNDLIAAVQAEFESNNLITISSGEIGIAFHNFHIPIDIIVPGGLRFNPEKINLAFYNFDFTNKDVVFIDDSYFSGRTYTVVKEAVEALGGNMIGAYVAYDGCRYKDPMVRSLYRYYDHFDVLGRPLA